MRKAERDIDFSKREEWMSGAEREICRQRFDGLAFLLDAEPVHGVRRRHCDPEEVGADIRSRIPYIRVRGVRGQQNTGEKDIGLNSAVMPVEIEIVDATQRKHGVVAG